MYSASPRFIAGACREKAVLSSSISRSQSVDGSKRCTCAILPPVHLQMQEPMHVHLRAADAEAFHVDRSVGGFPSTADGVEDSFRAGRILPTQRSSDGRHGIQRHSRWSI